ncbi:MAG: phosphodiester glycosidase family protein [Elusimicrobia bacterium]|nr:phosphodiester glycosidase family protein [Elusimicrobiota bacterium]
MIEWMAAAAWALAARADIGPQRCWDKAYDRGVDYALAVIERPSDNLIVSYEPMRFWRARGLGTVVVNGTYFGQGQPMGDVLASDGREYHPRYRVLRPGDGRVVDLGRRWALGRLRGKGTLAIARDDEAIETMDLYLGGGAILLLDGKDLSADNLPRGSTPGESFSPDMLSRPAARTAVGLRTVDGRQQLLIVSAPQSAQSILSGDILRPRGATLAGMAALMRRLGATDAVLFDGGGAAGFSAGDGGGGSIYWSPINASENLNPTHLAARSCL